MKTFVTRRLVRFAALVGAALLVLAVGVQTAFAAAVAGDGGSVGPVTAVPASSASSTGSATSLIVVAAVLAAAVAVAVWATLRARRRGEPATAARNVAVSDAYCARNPTSALCGP